MTKATTATKANPKAKNERLKGIKAVAIYVRKSRITNDLSESETLEKHRRQLITFAEENELEYHIFEEVISGTSTERNEFLKMLTLIEAQAFDAVLVVNFDRLTRNEIDGIKLRKTLQDGETLIIQLDPFDIIDLNNDGDLDKASFLTFFAEWEARQIKRRMKAGRIRGALVVKWIGTVPFAYRRNPSTGFLEVDERQAEVFRRIVKMFLSGMQTKAICQTLNLENVPSPKVGKWNDAAVRRMLVNEVYIGTAIFGKAKYIDRMTKKDKPREEWIIVPNAHPAIIDEATRDEIINLFDTRKRIHGQAQQGNHILSGLLKCPVCGSTLHFSRTPRGVWVRKCGYTDAFGNRCKNDNRGLAVQGVTEALAEVLKIKRLDLLKPMKEDKTADEVALKVKRLEAEITKIEKAIDRVLELYEFGDIDRATYNQRTNDRKAQKEELERQLKAAKAAGRKKSTEREIINQIDEVVDLIEKNDGSEETIGEINKRLRELIDEIIYIRPDRNTLTLKVKYM